MKVMIEIDDAQMKDVIKDLLSPLKEQTSETDEFFENALKLDRYIIDCLTKFHDLQHEEFPPYYEEMQEQTHLNDYRVYTDTMTLLYRM